LFAMMDEESYLLSDYEAAIFIPFLIQKVYYTIAMKIVSISHTHRLVRAKKPCVPKLGRY
jgi:hypothetical protein